MDPIRQYLFHSIYGDRVTERALRMGQAFQSAQKHQEIYARGISDPFHLTVKSYENLPTAFQGISIFHSSNENPLFGDISQQKSTQSILVRHYSPDPWYFAPYSHKFHWNLQWNRDFLASSKDHFNFAIADCESSREELLGYGYKRVELLEAIVGKRDFSAVASDRVLQKELSAVRGKIFVMGGVLSPDQNFDDGIRLFDWYRRFIDSESKLFILTRSLPEEDYGLVLKDLVCSSSLQSSVYFIDHRNLGQVRACYESGSLFLTTAESEGPESEWMEALEFGIPVLCHGNKSSQRFWKDSGVYFYKKDIPQVAEFMNCILGNLSLRNKVLKNQKERVQEISAQRSNSALLVALNSLGI